MPRGGTRPGAGRPKGSSKGVPKKQGREQIALARAKGLTPLEYMLSVMNNEAEDPARRDRMAQAAAPYVHAKLAPKAADTDDKRIGEQKTAEAEWNDLLN
ncbi:hypothetical protein DC522_01360 [Microvirga sp. KLBC 81]|uniref:hypothetical protein n=1 Tax=Microvirga sp. KLBC 81 TaxID=1862707 RepID=UPI000D50E4B9|nr:hypothetical protein [Microvirga sp. KLBC 81]PVE26439.1 hypothetical protein DC522_01360 [Microvirga sp. KLBC 81]